MARHSVVCKCERCEAMAAARKQARDTGKPMVLPATTHKSSWGTLGKKARRIGRVRSLSANSHSELSTELRMLWDTIPNRIRDSVVICRERHVTSDVLTYCRRKPVIDYRETLLCSFQTAVYQLWQSTHRDGAGFLSYPELSRIYAPTLLDDSSDFDKPVRRKRVSRRKLQYSLPEYSYPMSVPVLASGRERVVQDSIQPRPMMERWKYSAVIEVSEDYEDSQSTRTSLAVRLAQREMLRRCGLYRDCSGRLEVLEDS